MTKRCTLCLEIKPLDSFGVQRNVKDGRKSRCKTCLSELSRIRRIEHTDKVRESERNWRSKNPDKVKAMSKRSRERHADAYKERLERWKADNPERYRSNKRAHTQQRRALERQLISDYHSTDSSFIRSLYDGCAFSGSTDELHDDHFIALATGHCGTYFANMIPLSADLNLSKGSKNPFEWLNSRENIDLEKTARTVVLLAYLNDLTVKDYIDFVYWCYDNPRDKEDINEDNRDSLTYWLRITGRKRVSEVGDDGIKEA